MLRSIDNDVYVQVVTNDSGNATFAPTSFPTLSPTSFPTLISTTDSGVQQIADSRQFNYIALMLGLSFLTVFVLVVCAGVAARYTAVRSSSRSRGNDRGNDMGRQRTDTGKRRGFSKIPHQKGARQRTQSTPTSKEISDRLETCFVQDTESDEEFNGFVCSVFPNAAAAASLEISVSEDERSSTGCSSSGSPRRGRGGKPARRFYTKVPSPQKKLLHPSPRPTRVVATTPQQVNHTVATLPIDS